MNNPCSAGDGYKGCVDAGNGTCIACGEALYPKASVNIKVPAFDKSSAINAPQVIPPISDAQLKREMETKPENKSVFTRIEADPIFMAQAELEELVVELRQELNAATSTILLYATAARSIALNLQEFCDESLSYDEMIADAARKAGNKLQKAKEWNALCELELNNLRSLKDDLEGYLRAVLEHIAPMLKLYEPNLPEHPVIASIRDYLEKP